MQSTWIVVADSSRARIFRGVNTKAKLIELDSLDHPESRAKARDLVEDGTTTTFSSVGSSRSGVGADDAPQIHEHEVFARMIAEKLAHARFENKYDKLVLMAPPQFLGTLRHVLGTQFAKLIVQPVSKDLTRAPIDQVSAHLEPTSIAL